MDALFTFFKIIFMCAFGLSIVLGDKTISTEERDIPVWTIAACQAPIILLYCFLG